MIEMLWYFIAFIFVINVLIVFSINSNIDSMVKGTSLEKEFCADDPYAHFNLFSQVKFIKAVFNRKLYSQNVSLNKKIFELKISMFIGLLLFTSLVALSILSK